MEMKHMDKGQRSESSLSMSTARRSSNDYRSMDDLPPYHEERSQFHFNLYFLYGHIYMYMSSKLDNF